MAGTINFLDKIPQIAQSAGVLSKQQIYDVDFTQAVFDVAHEKGVNLVPEGQMPGDVLRQYNSPEKVASIIDKYNLDKRAINDKAQMFSTGYQAENAPYFMDTLEVFGHISAQQKSPLLGAQFAARTAETVYSIKTGKVKVSMDEALNQRAPRPDEANYLRAAQHVEKNGKILAAAISDNPALRNDDDVARALTALDVLSAQSFRRASEAAKGSQMNLVADEMEKQQAGQQKGLFLSRHAATSTLISKLEAGINKAADEVQKRNPEQATAMRGAMANSKAQIQELNVFGSLILPDVVMKKAKMGFADKVIHDRNNGQDTGRGY